MPNIVPLTFAPDSDTGWNVNPGALVGLSNFAPMNRGSYGSVGNGAYVAPDLVSGELFGKMFRSVSGSVRCLIFLPTGIKETTSNGTTSARGTGYDAGTTDWDAAAFGDAIIACNYLDGTQVSTSTTFAALSGGSPKARRVAANSNFVMLCDYNDGSNQYPDGWWCSGIGNYTTWAASGATQAANGRILEAPGPIRSVVAFKDGFVVFKDNSIHVMDYVGPPVIWSVRTVTNQVGCVAPHGVCEFAGKLYFVHTSGFYSFDGQTVTNVGNGITNSWLADMGYITGPAVISALGTAASNINLTQAVADDIENVVWFQNTRYKTESATNYYYNIMYGFNVVTGKWGRVENVTTSLTPHRLVLAYTNEVQTFKAEPAARVLYLSRAGSVKTAINYLGYPLATDSSGLITGSIGQTGVSMRLGRVWLRHMKGTQLAFTGGLTVAQFREESQATSLGAAFGTYNAEFDAYDVEAASNVKALYLTYEGGKIIELAGIGLDIQPAGRR